MVVKVGSLRHFSESTTRRFRSIKPNELILFFLRCLLILLVVMLLAQLLWPAYRHSSKWALWERGVEANSEVKRMTDSLISKGYEVRYFEEGFPLPEDTGSLPGVSNYWRLVEQLQYLPVSEAIVFSPAYLQGFRGERSSRASHILWIDVPTGEAEFHLADFVWNNDMMSVSGTGNHERTRLKVRRLTGNATTDLQPIAALTVTIAYDDPYAHDAAVLQSALQVLNQIPGYVLNISVVEPDAALGLQTDCLFWLSNRRPPALDARLIMLKETGNQSLLVRTGSRRWHLTRRLNQKAVLDDHLVLALADILPQGPLLPSYTDRRVMPEQMRWKPIQINKAAEAEESAVYADAGNWLALWILLTLLAERLVAWRRMQ